MQEVGFHEVNSAAELVTLVHSDVQLIQEAIGEKLPQFILYLSTFISGFVIALMKSWRLGLLLGCTVLPAILLSGWAIQTLSAKFARKASLVYTTASSMSEEIVSSIRTVYAFGAQGKLLELYYNRLMKSLHYSTRKSFFRAAVIGTAVGIIFSAYALAFFYGTILLVHGQVTAGSHFRSRFVVTMGLVRLTRLAGTVLAVFFAILVSCIGLTSAAPLLDCQFLSSVTLAHS
jgi:ATP-binding cassette subfamily B (MDR/TAP) protein 1